MLTREQKRMSLEIARLDYDYDPWGWGMIHWFAIADTLYHMGADTPHEWQFRHGPTCQGAAPASEDNDGGMWPDCEYLRFMDAGELGIECLTYAGRVMDRYLRFVKRAGRDY